MTSKQVVYQGLLKNIQLLWYNSVSQSYPVESLSNKQTKKIYKSLMCLEKNIIYLFPDTIELFEFK